MPRNLVFILSDDHRYDFLGFLGKPPFLRTPGMDRMAAEGAHLRNAFVSTSLCSPSRATILTGQYAHNHGVVDNSRVIRPDAVFFPQLLQEAGYHTAFIGKWHMGGVSDEPRPGFDRWVSWRGQGTYSDPLLNFDGERRQVQGYVTDLLTDYALEWVDEQRGGNAPFFLYLSHKAVHAEFEPAPRHLDRYRDAPVPYAATMANTEDNARGEPHWVREQRYGWHGVDFLYHGQMDFDTFYRRYCETLLALDESVDRVVDHLDGAGLSGDTLVVYMGDHGFSLGEHGLIDKRHAYEESVRTPLLAYAPGLIEPGMQIDELIQNIDVAATLLEVGEVCEPEYMDGESFLPLLRGEAMPWRDELLYEYYWDFNFPHTPTVYALRGERFKYVFYHGIWDRNEFFDLETDPGERHNLIDLPAYQERIGEMRERLFDRLEADDAVSVAFDRPVEGQVNARLLHRGVR